MKEKENINMFIDVIFYSINQLKENQNSEMIKIEHNKLVKPKIMDEFNSRIYYLRNMFFNVWNYIERENLDLDFKILISLYELQRAILFNQMYIANLGNFNNVMEQIISDYNFNSYNLYNEDYILYSEIPNVI